MSVRKYFGQQKTLSTGTMPDQPDAVKNSLPAAQDKASSALVKIPDHVTEFLPVARALATTIPGYDQDKVSDQKLAFIVLWTETLDEKSAASGIGIPQHVAGKWARQPFCMGLFAKLCDTHFKSVGYAQAQRALVRIVSDPGASPSAVVAAARTIHDWIDADNKANGEASGKGLADMTIEELANFIHKFETGTQLAAQTITIDKQDQ